MEILYRAAADIIVAVHFAFVAFVIGGLLAVLVGALLGWSWTRNFYFRCLHLLAILAVVVEAFCGVTCPLTTWENALRVRAGDAGYHGDFLAMWLHRALFYEAEPWVFTLAYCGFGLAVLVAFALVPPRLPRTWERNDAAARAARDTKS